MKVVYTSVSDLIPYAFNNRKHSETQVDRVANSIQQFGFNQPIVVDENNVILVGHCRRDAAKKLGIDKVPVLKVCNLTEPQKRAYRVIDNKLSDEAEWQVSNLDEELDFLSVEFDLFEDFGLEELQSNTSSSEITIAKLPKYSWVLVGIELERAGELSDIVEKIELIDGIIIEKGVSD